MKELVDLLLLQIKEIVYQNIEKMEANQEMSIDELCDIIRLGLKEKMNKNNFD